MAGPRSFNIVSFSLTVFLAATVYFSIQIIPALWKKGEVESIIKEESYGANRKSDEALKAAIIRSALQKQDLTIKEEDVYIERLEDRVKVEVSWIVPLHLFSQEIYQHTFRVRKETVFY